MRGRIPDETLHELRDRAGIVEVVSAHVSLRRVGRHHVGLCPFHAEKTPSFTVNEERGIFHCFGCGAGGNVFTFLMKIENLAFPEVVERLARRYGVTLPERGVEDPNARVREALFALNDKAARFYQRYLWEAGEAQPARAYLAERGISRQTAERFALGYAPAGGDVLVGRLRQAGVPLEQAVRLGLVGVRQGSERHYDRFRGRLTFPITDSSGRVVGFGSRSVPGTASAAGDLPKYLNSPETPLYRKGAQLYGLAVARDAIRDVGRALVVEGYFDVLALAEAGIAHVVAALGTALTVDQLRLLKRFTRDIVVFFDGDAAGQAAAEKSLPAFLEAGLWGHGAFLPSGDDPDTFVRREGADAVQRLLAGAVPLFDFFLDRTVAPGSTLVERAGVAQSVARLLGKIADPFEYDMTVRRAAERLGLSEELLRRQPLRSETPSRPISFDRAPGAEELLVTLMLQDPKAVPRVAAADALRLFADGPWRRVAGKIIEAARRGAEGDAAELLVELDQEDAARVAGRLVSGMGVGGAVETLISDCLAKLERQWNVRRRQELRREIRNYDAAGDQDALARAQKEHEALARAEVSTPGPVGGEGVLPDVLAFGDSPQVEDGGRS